MDIIRKHELQQKSYRKLAAEYGVSAPAIFFILKNKKQIQVWTSDPTSPVQSNLAELIFYFLKGGLRTWLSQITKSATIKSLRRYWIGA